MQTGIYRIDKPQGPTIQHSPFSCSAVSDSATPWTAARQPPWPSPTPWACSNSCPLSRWRHPTVSSSVVPVSSRLQSFPASGSFQMSQLFTSDGQSIGVSASASVLPMNIQDWFPLGWTGWISLQVTASESRNRPLSDSQSLPCTPLLAQTLPRLHPNFYGDHFLASLKSFQPKCASLNAVV